MDQNYINPMMHNKMSYNYSANNQTFNLQATTDNVLFVADLPEETSEEDLESFFKNYNYKIARLIR